MKKSILSFILALVLVLSSTGMQAFAAPALSDSVEKTPSDGERYTLILSVTPILSVSGKTATYTLNVSCVPSVNSITATLQLQRKVNGTWVNDGSSWKASSTTCFLSTSGTRTVESGHSYRLKVSVTASNGTTTGSTTEYSS